MTTERQRLGSGILPDQRIKNTSFSYTSPAGTLLAVKLHSEKKVILNEKYEILISLILQWQDNHRKKQLSLIIG